MEETEVINEFGKYEFITNVILISLIGCFVLLLVGMLVYAFIANKYYRTKHKERIFECIKNHIDEEIEEKLVHEITTIYNSFYSKWVCGYNMIQINSELSEDINIGKYNKKFQNTNSENTKDRYIELITKLNNKLNEMYTLQDNDLNNLVSNVSDDSIKNEIIMLFQKKDSFDNGRIYEKDNRLRTLENEIETLKKKKRIAKVVNAISILSGLITIAGAAIPIMKRLMK